MADTNATSTVAPDITAPIVPATQGIDVGGKGPTKKDEFAIKYGVSGNHARYIRSRLDGLDKSDPATVEAFLNEFAPDEKTRSEMSDLIKAFRS